MTMTIRKNGFMRALLIVARLVAYGSFAIIYGCSTPVTPSSPRVLFAPNSGNPMALELAAPSTGGIPSLVLSGKYVQLYNAADKLIRTIHRHGGWQGTIAFDKQGDIYYDSYQQYSDRVLIYAPPYKATPKIVSFYGMGYSEGIVVDHKTGVFAIMMDAYDPDPSLYSALFFFRHGETQPCAVIKEPSSWYWDNTGSFDSHGTLFVADATNSGDQVVSASGQCKAARLVSYSPTLPQVGLQQFNTKDQMVIDEGSGFNNAPIVTYPHPANGQLGTPVAITVLDEINNKHALMTTLTSDGNHAWASTFEQMALYNFPQGGAPVKVLNIPQIGGGAVYPPPLP